QGADLRTEHHGWLHRLEYDGRGVDPARRRRRGETESATGQIPGAFGLSESGMIMKWGASVFLRAPSPGPAAWALNLDGAEVAGQILAALATNRDEGHQTGLRQRVAPAMAGAVLTPIPSFNSPGRKLRVI